MSEVVHTVRYTIVRGSRANKWAMRELFLTNCAGAAGLAALVLGIVAGTFGAPAFVSNILDFLFAAGIIGFVVGLCLFFVLGLLLPREHYEERVDHA